MTQTVSAKESEPVAVTPAVAADPEEKTEEKHSKAKSSDKDERAEVASSDSTEHEEVSSTKSEGKKASRRMKRGGASSEEKEEKKERAKAEPRRSKPRAALLCGLAQLARLLWPRRHAGGEARRAQRTARSQQRG